MSIINNAHPGSQIRILCLIDRVLCRKSPKAISEEDLLAICRPESLPKSDGAMKRFPENLNFWVREGLWEKDDNGIRNISTATSENLPSRVLKNCIQSVDNDLNFEGKKVEPFMLALTALLAQDKFSFYGGQRLFASGSGNVAEVINGCIPLRMNASNEAATLLEYGSFLGFFELVEKARYIVDPTRAIEAELDTLFHNKDLLPIRDFITGLANVLPMLDGGVYRDLVEPHLQTSGWQPTEEIRISASLSHALLRLEAGLRIVLDYNSDDQQSLALSPIEQANRLVSVIRIRRGNS